VKLRLTELAFAMCAPQLLPRPSLHLVGKQPMHRYVPVLRFGNIMATKLV
jgi:hypothetical protein